MKSADIIKAGSALQKNLENSNFEPALDILRQLRDELVATDAILKETKIGLAVGKLRKHENRKVVELSNEIVRKWKQEIDAAKAKNGNKSTSASEKASPAPVTTSKSTPAAPKAPRTADSDGVQTKGKTGDQVRDNCVKLIYNGLAVDAAESITKDLLLDKSISIESIIYKKFNETVDNAYKQKMRSLFLNLKGTNISLRKDVVSGNLTPEVFCDMTPEQMASDERKAENKKLEEEGIFAAMAAVSAKASTDMFRCSKCGKKETTYYQMQTRSADEPMTTFITCVNCGKKWKM